MNKVLLLNNNFEVLAFISERRAIRLLFKNKVEIISIWQGKKIYFGRGFIECPATLKMKYFVSVKPSKLVFSRKLILRRDNYKCSYCLNKFTPKELTIDHVLPKSLGGGNSFTNCVTACFPCNFKKRNRTPEEANMQLKINPHMPTKYLCYLPSEIEWHNDWLFFII